MQLCVNCIFLWTFEARTLTSLCIALWGFDVYMPSGRVPRWEGQEEMRAETPWSLWRWPDHCLHCDQSEPLKKGLSYLVGDATSRVHTVREKGFTFSQDALGCQKPASTWTTADCQWTTIAWWAGGLYTDFLWKVVLPLDGLTAPRALGDVGLCGWNNREESPAEESGRNHAYAEPFPDRWDAPMTAGCPGKLGV